MAASCTEYNKVVEERLTLVLDNSITCELYVMSNVMYHLTAKYTVYLWVSLRSFLAPLQGHDKIIILPAVSSSLPAAAAACAAWPWTLPPQRGHGC